MDNVLKEGKITSKVKTTIMTIVVVCAFLFFLCLLMQNGAYKSDDNIYMDGGWGITSEGYSKYLDENGFTMRLHYGFWEFPYIYIGFGFLFIALCSVIYYLLIRQMQITVTEKRVYGKTYFGRSVDLPVDSISAVGSSWLKGIAVATSSGKINFLFIEKSNEIHELIRNLLINRQEAKKAESAPQIISSLSNADELKKYKELLDTGVITQEEFDAKKKQLLGM